MVLSISLAFPGSGAFSASAISLLMAVARFLASLHSVVSFGVLAEPSVMVFLSVSLWVSQVHQVTSGSMELGRVQPPAGNLQLGSLVPVSLSIHAFQLSHVHQVLHEGR